MTTPKALSAAMQQCDADSILLREMQQMLRAELEKPPETQDLDAVDEMTEVICELCGLEQAVTAHSRSGLETFRTNITPNNAATIYETKSEPITEPVKPKRKIRWKKYAAIAASFACALLIGNIATKGALGDSLLSTGAKLIHGGIEITLSEPDSTAGMLDLPEAKTDPYGMQTACNAAGFTALMPQYLPENLTIEDQVTNCTDDQQDVIFWFSEKDNPKRTIRLHFIHYANDSVVPPINIPTQDYEMSEKDINGIPVYQVIEDKYYTSTFHCQSTTYVITCTNIEQDECDRILCSYLENNAANDNL